jgi:phosphoglycolate phosphatase-like HAD superfamily hydrolase
MNLDLDAYDRFLLHALEKADSLTQQRALQMLGHDVDNSYAAQRIEDLAREAQYEHQRAERYASHLRSLYQQLYQSPSKMMPPPLIDTMANGIHKLLADYGDEIVQ